MQKLSKLRQKLPDVKKHFGKIKSLKVSQKIAIVALIFVIIACLIYLIYPTIPAVVYAIKPVETSFDNYDLPDDVMNKLVNNPAGQENNPEAAKKIVITGNRLLIPSMGLDTAIVEGKDLDVLNTQAGVWRDPQLSTPDKTGNTVLAGHRFQYLGPNTTTLYNLDKVKVGDKMLVLWHSKYYIYQVFNIETVDPNQVEVIYNHANVPHELTLYSCTPIATRDKRLVIHGKLV